jgi:uncharacterized protein
LPKPASLLSSHEVVSARIHAGLDGVRIGHLSDVHVRTGVRPRRLHQAVEMLNQLKPDLVALTGDYVCMSPRPLPELTAALKRLTAPAYAVLGNHDHWSGARAVRAALEKAGVDVMQNEHRVVRAGKAALHLVGVDDSITRNDDPERAFSGVPEGATAVTLSHDPKSADHLHAYHPALILSGHTHGGQVVIHKITSYLWKRVGMKYVAGFFDVNGAVLYVNRGLGASVPIRFRAPCEVGHLTLRSAA